MKKIYFDRWHNNGRTPFWMPWGLWGYIWRFLVFMALLFTLFVLLSMFRSCNGGRRDYGERGMDLQDPRLDTLLNRGGNNVSNDNDRYNDPSEGDNPEDGNNNTPEWPRDIPNPGPNLPSPDDNQLPPVNEDDIIDNEESRTQIAQNRLNVILDSSSDDETFRAFAAEFKQAYPGDDYKIVYYNTLTKLLQLEVPPAERERVKQELPGKIPDISFRVFDETMFDNFCGYTPSDPGFEDSELSWYFRPIQAHEAWEITKGSPDVTVAIVDSYFDMTHRELASERIVKPYSIRFHSTDVRPTRDCPENDPGFFHGSAVASLAVGSMDNDAGLSGIAPGCKLMPVSLGHMPTTMAMLEGTLYAIYQGADVINLSIGSGFADDAHTIPIDEQINISETYGQTEAGIWQYIFDLADARNITIVWAAGNEKLFSGMDASKRGENTIRVAAVDSTLQRADFSNFGNFSERGIMESTISAPGDWITCAHPFDSYAIGGGTSYSAPIVAGAVALMKSIDKSLTNRDIIRILQETGTPVQNCPEIGPLLQIKDALLKVKEQFINFDDIMANHNLLTGTWQSTTLINRIDGNNFYPNDVRIYFQTANANTGIVRYYEAVSTQKEYIAYFRIEWKEDRIIFHQDESATTSDGGQTYLPSKFICYPDAEGLLQCRYSSERNENILFHIKKINNSPNIDITSYE